MQICSLEFVLSVALLAALFFWLPGVRLRQAVLACCNAGFLYSLIPNSASWLALAIILLTGYAVVRLLQAYPSRAILATYLMLLLTAFVILKKYDFLAGLLPTTVWQHTVGVVGLSYMLCRQVHVSVDAMQGQVAELSPWTYLNYQLNLFGLIAGPIQRIDDFQASWSRLEPLHADWYDTMRAFRRLFWGVIKINIIGAAFWAVYEHFLASALHPGHYDLVRTVGKFLIIFYSFPFFLYFNFSGYCDIVIAAASLFGIRMPENFNNPYFSRNLIEYWTRWHRTLGFWVRDYIFLPLYKSSVQRWPRHGAALAVPCYFIALFATGIWHGAAWNFAIFGVLNGFGVAVVKLWENYLIARRGRPGLRRYLQSRIIKTAAIFLNFHFVCITMFIFALPLDQATQVVKMLYRVVQS